MTSIKSYNLKSLFGLIILLFCLLPLAQAQNHFEGSMTIKLSDGSNPSDNEEVTLFVRENRLRISGNAANAVNFAPISGESVLLRADQRDILIFSDDNTAVQIKLQELETLLNMFSQGQNQPSVPEVSDNITIQKTGQTRRIQGYNAEQLISTNSDKPNEVVHIWVTDQIKIDWVKMFDAFGSLSKQVGLEDFKTRYAWDLTKTPLLIQTFRNNELRGSIEMVDITSRRLTQAEIDVPQGVQLMTFFQMMMRQSQR